MNKNIVVPYDNLEEILGRLTCFSALLETIHFAMDEEDKMVDSMASAHDLLSCICRDFQSDIDSAEEVPA